MSLFTKLRPHLVRGVLFTLSLTVALLCASHGGLAEPSVVTPSERLAQSLAPDPAPSPTPTALSLTDTVRKTVLDNEMTVLTKEIHTAPVVAVQVWYRVGSRNESAGINGISHQLEHLLFKGTTERPIQFGRLFSALGSASNAFTSYDQTAYFGTVKRENLNSLLVLEADRMVNAIIDANQLTSEKRVVISELQGYENSPNYRLSRAVMRAAFPNRPYGLPVGGTKADVEQFTVEQVKDYYRKHYSPSNATLVITGDFQTEPTLKLVQETFGKIAKQADTPVTTSTAQEAPPAANNSQPIVLKEPGSAALFQAVYPLPNVNHPDVPALHVLDLVLTEGRSSRLYQSLVESGLASTMGGYSANLIEFGWYNLAATAASGRSPTQIAAAVAETLTGLQQNGITPEELNRAKTQLRASVILQNRDITSQAFQLGDDQTSAGDYRHTDRFLAAVANVTAADVQRVAKTYLTPEKQTVGFFEPTQATGKSGTPSNFGQTAESFSAGPPVDPAEVAKYLPAVAAPSARSNQALPESLTLANGLKVLLLRDPSTPTITLSGFIQAGSEYDTSSTAGLASLTAENLRSGTQTQDALTLAKTLENRGISLNFNANREGVAIAANSLTADLPVLLQTLGNVLDQANFPEKELELSRQRALTALKLELDNPARLGRRVFQQAIYPANHPFYSFPTEASLKNIQRNTVQRFYQQHYRPDVTVLTLVGDFEPAAVRSLLNQTLGQWKAQGDAPQLTYSPTPLPKSVVRLTPELPGKTQSISYLGYAAINRTDPRYYAALILNQVLGGDTLSSRLGTEIRDRQGLTYGIYSYFQAGREQGPFLIQMQTAPEDTQRAIASTLKLLEQLRQDGISAEELAAAKRSLTSSYPVDLADPDSLARTILMNETYGLSREEIRKFPNKIQAVTLAEVNQAIKSLIHPDQLVIVTAGPALATSK